MASIRKETLIDARPETVWAAVRDVGAVHERLAPGFVVDTRIDGDARIVTFGNGLVARELIVDIDDAARRLVWSVVGGRFKHHNGTLQVFADGEGRSRLVCIADLLPNELAGFLATLMEQGSGVMKQTLERVTPLSRHTPVRCLHREDRRVDGAWVKAQTKERGRAWQRPSMGSWSWRTSRASRNS